MTKQDSLAAAKQLISKYNLPPKPQLLVDIKAAHPELDKIAALIAEDEGAASTVLKIINSPAYGMSTTVTNVTQAVSLMGLEKVMNVVNSVLVAQVLKNQVDPSKMEDYWLANNNVAVAALEIASQCDQVSIDEVNMLALFHNSAMPLLVQKEERYFSLLKSWDGSENGLTDFEDDQFGINHCLLGFILAKFWGINDDVSLAIRDHHNLIKLKQGAEQGYQNSHRLVAVLKMAETMAQESSILTNDLELNEWHQFKDEVFLCLGISESDYEEMQSVVSERLLDSELAFFK